MVSLQSLLGGARPGQSLTRASSPAALPDHLSLAKTSPRSTVANLVTALHFPSPQNLVAQSRMPSTLFLRLHFPFDTSRTSTHAVQLAGGFLEANHLALFQIALGAPFFAKKVVSQSTPQRAVEKMTAESEGQDQAVRSHTLHTLSTRFRFQVYKESKSICL